MAINNLIKLDQATQILAEIRTVDDAKQLIDLAEAARVYARQVQGLPNSPGIYFVYSGDSLLYVGQARNIRKRLGTHHRKKLFEKVKELNIGWEDVSPSMLNMMERYYIEALRPAWNYKPMCKSKRIRKFTPINTQVVRSLFGQEFAGFAENINAFFGAFFGGKQ